MPLPDSAANEQGAQDNQARLTRMKLDILLLYLRRVHSYCFYCAEEYDDERMLSTRCGPQHIRNAQKISSEDWNTIVESNKGKQTTKEMED